MAILQRNKIRNVILFFIVGSFAGSFRVLGDSQSDGYDLFRAIDEKNVVLIKQLLGKGADPNVVMEIGETPLHWASIRGNLEIVKILVDHGANVHMKNLQHETPYDYAKMRHHHEVAKYLRSKMQGKK